VSALASDKVVEVLAFVTMMLLALGGHLPGVVRDKVATIAIGLVVVIVVIAIAMWLAKGRILRWLEETRNLLRGRALVIAYALSILSWGAQVAAYSLGARAAGLDLPLTAIVVTVVSVNVAGVIRSTPGNLGVFQMMFVFALTPFGVASAQAVAASMLIQSAQILSAVIAGAVAASLYRSG